MDSQAFEMPPHSKYSAPNPMGGRPRWAAVQEVISGLASDFFSSGELALSVCFAWRVPGWGSPGGLCPLESEVSAELTT